MTPKIYLYAPLLRSDYMYQTTITSWALLVARAIDDSGHSSHLVFEKAGLDINRLRDPNARYSYQGMTRL